MVFILSLCFESDSDLKLLANCLLCKKQAEVAKELCLCAGTGTKDHQVGSICFGVGGGYSAMDSSSLCNG